LREGSAPEEADDDNESSCSMLSQLPPSAGMKGSTLLRDKPDTIKAISVFIGAAKTAAP